MALPIRSLPVLQNWDCSGCGTCCHEYEVAVTEEERQRILSQDWDKDPRLAGVDLFRGHGPWWDRRYQLNHRANDACVFLSPQGRCLIHERFGAAAKPLACRLYPFILVPTGDHWRIGMRFACPSAAASKGRPVGAHAADLEQYAVELERKLAVSRGSVPAPGLQTGQEVDWSDLLQFVQVLMAILSDRRTRVEHRLRCCLALANLCRQARFEKIKGARLAEFLNLLATGLEDDVPVDAALVAAPTWVGRILFRQALALYARKDRGPGKGLAARGHLALFLAAWRFALGKGTVPRVHADLPTTTFQQVESRSDSLPDDADLVLERYYCTKISSLQFCGASNFDMGFWEGLQSVALTLPIILWVARSLADLPRAEAVARAISMVDTNFGFNHLLGTRRQRFALRILAMRGELERLIAWYSR